MFQFTGCPLLTLWIHVRIPAVFTGGFPHSEISGSQPVCGSPKLIAAYHVFHRLSVPRHPPCALLCLTFCTVHRMINHSVCCILIINNLAWLFMITIVCRSFDQRPIIALVNNNLIFALTSKTDLVVSMFACFCIRFSRCQNTLLATCCQDIHRHPEWRQRDSNSRPPACKAGALPTELCPQINAWHPPILPCSHPHSTVGRKGLNRRVRDGNGCYPFTHRHQANIAM